MISDIIETALRGEFGRFSERDLRTTEEYRNFGCKIVDCPVCGRKTLDSHWVCSGCGWEYDGTTDENAKSTCNFATLAEYRELYRKMSFSVEICSRRLIEEMKAVEFPQNAAVISFYTPRGDHTDAQIRMDYSGVCDRVFYVPIPDIDIECLPDYGYTYDSYLAEADGLAIFIRDAKEDGCTILCQCDFGQSRSAACAAAILQHYEGRGIDVFADYRYYPNQLVYHKVYDALEKAEKADLRENHPGKREFVYPEDDGTLF